jgi:hypothetical protein
VFFSSCLCPLAPTEVEILFVFSLKKQKDWNKWRERTLVENA